jgi:hypothetical protein
MKCASHVGCNACNAFYIAFATRMSRIWSAPHLYNIRVTFALHSHNICVTFARHNCIWHALHDAFVARVSSIHVLQMSRTSSAVHTGFDFRQPLSIRTPHSRSLQPVKRHFDLKILKHVTETLLSISTGPKLAMWSGSRRLSRGQNDTTFCQGQDLHYMMKNRFFVFMGRAHMYLLLLLTIPSWSKCENWNYSSANVAMNLRQALQPMWSWL